MPDTMNINQVRTAALNTPDHNSALLCAIVYLGDSIREACSDIGPAIADSGRSTSAELGDVALSLRDLGREFAGITAAVDGIGK